MSSYRFSEAKIQNGLSKLSLSEMTKSYIIFWMLRQHTLVDVGIQGLELPVVGRLLKWVIKRSIFPFFCGGEDISQTIKKSQALFDSSSIKSIIDHSQEEIASEALREISLQNKINLLQRLQDQQFVDSIPLKCTALIPPELLEKLSELMAAGPQLSDDLVIDSLNQNFQSDFNASFARMKTLCEAAQRYNISLLFDAEQSFRQPGIELFSRKLCCEFNKPNRKPTIYNTYQMYLKRSFKVLDADLKHASRFNYVFAAKIVRGAYMVAERSRANEFQLDDPVLLSKSEVDSNFDMMVKKLLKSIREAPHPSQAPHILIATHNWNSIQKALENINALSIPIHSEHVKFAQILGMCDHISIFLGRSGYNVLKLICFGDFEHLMPWLIRRFQENQDIFGAMQTESAFYKSAIKRRLIDVFSFMHA